MHIYIHICMCKYIHACTCIHVYTLIHTHAYMHANIHTYTYTHTDVIYILTPIPQPVSIKSLDSTVLKSLTTKIGI